MQFAGGGRRAREEAWNHHDFGEVLLPFFLSVSVFAGADASLSALILIPMLILGVAGYALRMFHQQDAFQIARGVLFAAMVLFTVFYSMGEGEEEGDDCGEPAGKQVFSWLEVALLLGFCLVAAVGHNWARLYHLLPSPTRRWFRRVFVHQLRWIESIPGPTALDVIDELEEVVVFHAGECCSVCLEDFKLGNRANKLRCGHVFHRTCVTPWLLMKNTCPVCRACVDGSAPVAVAAAAPPALLPPNPAWLCLGRIVDPEFALDARTETVSSLMLLPQASLVTRALQTRAITALPPPNQTSLANRLFHQLSHVH